ncbi:tetratricopeptide repeat protein [Breoghania sp. L-A4]|uniref:SEL1-like repeat protein n=1 Tax=Breoghania sp. L-A4 TaxID=2304600 RepID=UPI0013C31726|nr:tetratricopeptide repeat protein [Breoghania sp. L-A4]
MEALTRAHTALERGHHAAALSLLTPLAEQGLADAQSALAGLYDRGLGVPQNYAAAAAWYRKAADQGDAAAQNGLARLLAGGFGVPQDQVAALAYFRKAAEQGAAEHQFDLATAYDNGIGVDKDPREAAKWYERAASQGLAEAQASLGVLYYTGAGVPRDLGKALELYRAAAQQGSARAQNNLGRMYTKGEGVAQDYASAVDWFRKAAEQGLPQAIRNLGVMYDNGFGIRQDDAAAIELYRLAGRKVTVQLDDVLAEIGLVYDHRLAPPLSTGDPAAELAATRAAASHGDPVSQFMLAHVLAQGLTGAPDLRQAGDWYRKSAESGLVSAMTNLGLLYLTGRGVPQDFVLGYMWINVAAASGQQDAVRVRDAIGPRMTSQQINEAQKLASARWRSARESGVLNQEQ